MQKNRSLFLVAGIVGVVVIISVGLFLISRTNSQPDMAEYNNLLNSAKLSVQNKEYTVALKTYVSITDKFPSQADGYKGIVEILLSKNIVEQAANIADSAGSRITNQEAAMIYLLVGDKYYAVSDYVNAQIQYKKALDKDLSNTLVKVLNAKVLMKLGDFDGATRISEINDDGSTQYFESELIKAASYRSDLDKAKFELDKIASRKSADNLLNQQYSWLNDAVTMALTKKENQIYVAASLSSAYINMGYPKLAVNILEPLKDKMGEYWDGLYFLGRAYFDSGDYAKSIETLQAALLVVQDSFEVQIMLGKAYFASSNIDKAIQAYDAGITLSSGDEKVRYLKDYFNVLFAQSQYAKAISVLNIIESISDSNWLQLAYLKVYYQTQAYEKLKVHLDALAKKTDLTTQEKTEYYAYYVDYALETSDPELAKNLLDEMQGVDGSSALYKYESGRYLFQSGDNDEAKKALEKAIEFDLDGSISENAQKLLAKIE